MAIELAGDRRTAQCAPASSTSGLVSNCFVTTNWIVEVGAPIGLLPSSAVPSPHVTEVPSFEQRC